MRDLRISNLLVRASGGRRGGGGGIFAADVNAMTSSHGLRQTYSLHQMPRTVPQMNLRCMKFSALVGSGLFSWDIYVGRSHCNLPHGPGCSQTGAPRGR